MYNMYSACSICSNPGIFTLPGHLLQHTTPSRQACEALLWVVDHLSCLDVVTFRYTNTVYNECSRIQRQ